MAGRSRWARKIAAFLPARPRSLLARCLGLFLLVLLPTLPGTASAAEPSQSPRPTATLPAVHAAWSIRGFFTGVNSRARVIQVCIVFACLGLFILLKKFDSFEGRRQKAEGRRKAAPDKPLRAPE